MRAAAEAKGEDPDEAVKAMYAAETEEDKDNKEITKRSSIFGFLGMGGGSKTADKEDKGDTDVTTEKSGGGMFGSIFGRGKKETEVVAAAESGGDKPADNNKEEGKLPLGVSSGALASAASSSAFMKTTKSSDDAAAASEAQAATGDDGSTTPGKKVWGVKRMLGLGNKQASGSGETEEEEEEEEEEEAGLPSETQITERKNTTMMRLESDSDSDTDTDTGTEEKNKDENVDEKEVDLSKVLGGLEILQKANNTDNDFRKPPITQSHSIDIVKESWESKDPDFVEADRLERQRVWIEWFQTNVSDISSAHALKYINLLWDEHITTSSRLQKRLKKNPNTLIDIGFHEEDAEDIANALNATEIVASPSATTTVSEVEVEVETKVDPQPEPEPLPEVEALTENELIAIAEVMQKYLPEDADNYVSMVTIDPLTKSNLQWGNKIVGLLFSLISSDLPFWVHGKILSVSEFNPLTCHHVRLLDGMEFDINLSSFTGLKLELCDATVSHLMAKSNTVTNPERLPRSMYYPELGSLPVNSSKGLSIDALQNRSNKLQELTDSLRYQIKSTEDNIKKKLIQIRKDEENGIFIKQKQSPSSSKLNSPNTAARELFGSASPTTETVLSSQVPVQPAPTPGRSRRLSIPIDPNAPPIPAELSPYEKRVAAQAGGTPSQVPVQPAPTPGRSRRLSIPIDPNAPPPPAELSPYEKKVMGVNS